MSSRPNVYSSLVISGYKAFFTTDLSWQDLGFVRLGAQQFLAATTERHKAQILISEVVPKNG